MSLLNLRELQIGLQQHILQGDPRIQAEIIGTHSLSADFRLRIYRDAYYSRLSEILELDYPGVKKLLKDTFEKCCHDYIDCCPSTFRSVRWFGKYFSEFLKTQVLDESVIEMAEFEWIMAESFDAQDAPVMTVEAMAAIPPEQWADVCFALHPSAHRMCMAWNTTAVWSALSTDSEKSDQKEWLIWRKALNVQFCPLSVDEAFMIDAIKEGNNFASICEGLCEWIDVENVGMHAAMLLKRFLLDELISPLSGEKVLI